MWQPIETAPKDQFLLLWGPSGYTTIPMVVTTGRMCSDYHAGRWIDHANDDLTDWGFVPTHWMPMLTAPNAQPAPSEHDESVRKSWARFSHELHRSPDAPNPGMSEAFEQHFSQSFTDREWRAEASTWAAAWKAAKRHGAQPATTLPDGWKEAAIAWEVCASIHREYGKGKDPFFNTRQGDFVKHANDARAMLAAAPETKP